mgnify:CR=1 FL=1
MANGNGILKNGITPALKEAKKFLFVSWESLSGDLALQIKKEGHEVKIYIKSETDKDVYDGFLEKVDDWKKFIDWADVVCYDKKTEILTDTGWKLIKNVNKKDFLATLNPDNFELEYHKPNRLIKEKYYGKMIRYNSSENEFCVTPVHKMFVKRYNGKYSFEKANDIFKNTRKHIKLGCNWHGRINEVIKIPDYKIEWNTGVPKIKRAHTYKGFLMKTCHLMAIVGFYISEGATIKRWNNLNGIRIYQNYGETLNKFKNILKNAEVIFCATKKEKGEEIRIHNGALAKFLVDNFGNGTFNKFVPDWIKEADSENLKILFNWLMLGDGHSGKHHSFYYSVSKKLLNDLQEILLKIGLAGRIRGNVLSVIKNRNLEPRLKDKKYWTKINYNDYVYCVEVKNHIIYVRRNGKPMWCGNCFDDVGFGKEADQLRKQGKLIVGGSEYTDKLEEDREFGQAEMRKIGMLILPHWEFLDHDAALKFIEENPGRYVYKPSGFIGSDSKGLLFLGKDEDGKDLHEIIRSNKKVLGERVRQFQLQKFVQGVEIAVGAFFNGKDFIYPININFEHKKLFPGDIGPYTGEMGTTMYWSGPNTIYKTTLEKMKAEIKKSGYVGYIDINCIANGRGIYPLEWTCRMGYPHISIAMEGVLSNWGDFFYSIAKGENFELKTKKGFQIGVICAVPPFPFNDKSEMNIYKDLSIIFKKPSLDGIHLGDVKLIEGNWQIAGESGYALVVTGSGVTMEDARKQVYSRLENILLQNMFYRTDIGLGWYEDSDKLQTWGYLY